MSQMRGRASTARLGWSRGLVTFTVAVLVVVPGQALASGGEESDQANLLVLQAISLIANQAEVETITERLGDALASPDTEGTDLAMVQQALALVERSGEAGSTSEAEAGLEEAQLLLTGAIDIRAATGYGEMPGPGEVADGVPPFARGAATGTTVVLNEFKLARGVRNGGDVVLLGLAGLAILAGLYLSRRWRPSESIHELRRRSAEVR